MSNKRIKISFNTVNNGEFTIIAKSEIAETNKRVKVAMKEVVRVFEKNESHSQKQAARLVLNT